MNKRKILSILALCLAFILLIMTSVPIYRRGYNQWRYLFGDDSGLLFGIIGTPLMITALVFAILAFYKKDRAKRFIALSVGSTWLSGTLIAVATLIQSDDGVTPAICYFVLCAPVFILNLVLKDAPAAQASVQSTSDAESTVMASSGAVSSGAASSGISHYERGIHGNTAADFGRQHTQKNYVENRPMTKKDAEGLLAYIWVRQYNTLPYEEALDKIMAYLIENKYVIAPETATSADPVASESVESAAEESKTRVINAEISKNLRLARQAREEGNSEDAKNFYGRVREEDPENGEAKFYYAYYSLQEGTNGELPKRFENLCAVLPTSIRLIVESAWNKDEQLKIIEDIAKTFAPETWAEIRYMIHKNVEDKIGDDYVTVFDLNARNSVYETGKEALNALGDQIGALYGNDPECKRIASVVYEEYVALLNNWYNYKKLSTDVKILMREYKELGDKVGDDPAYKQTAIGAWSGFVMLAQKFYAYVEKGEAEKYAEKIKKLDPSYVMPQKSGCISKV